MVRGLRLRTPSAPRGKGQRASSWNPPRRLLYLVRSRSTPPGRPELFDPARDRCRSGDTDDLVITPKPLQRAIRFVRAHGATPTRCTSIFHRASAVIGSDRIGG